jgi:outer membrane protein assembly factor BamB
VPAPVQGKPQLQSDAQHTGRSPYAGPAQLKLVRSLQTQAPDDPATSNQPDIQSDTVIGRDGTIYLSTFPGLVLALTDGPGDKLDVKWQFHLGKASAYHAAPAIGSDGTLLIGIVGADAEARLYGFLAPASGSQPRNVWLYDVGATPFGASPNIAQVGLTVAADGTIYAIGGAGNLAVLTLDGKLKWTARSGLAFHSAPALAGGGVVYLSSTDGNLYAIVPPSSGAGEGAIAWKFPFGDRPGIPRAVNKRGEDNSIGSSSSPTVRPDGTVYVGASNSTFYAINPDGTQKWNFEAEAELAGIWSSAALSLDGRTIYFGANKGGVYAVSTTDGKKLWQNTLFGGSVYASPTLDRNGTLYVGTTSGHVFALDSQTGRQLSVYDSGGAVWSTPAIRPDGTLVAANRKGLVMVLGGA